MHPEPPTFSIIIATRDRPAQLGECLQALSRIEYPRERLEVIVVDDGSATPLDTVVQGWPGQSELVLLAQSGAGPAAARNRGLAQARGEYVAFTDDDCRPAPDWLARLAAGLEHAPGRAIGGRTVNAMPANPYSEASQMLISYLYHYYNRDPEDVRFLTTNNLALPAALLRDLGGLDATYTRAAAEDRELCDRWLQRGLRLTYAPDAVVYHAHWLTLRTFWQQHVTYGRGAFRYRLARAARRRGPVRVEPLPFYTNLLAYPFVRHRGRRAWVLATLLALSQVANAAGFVAEWLRHTREHPR